MTESTPTKISSEVREFRARLAEQRRREREAVNGFVAAALAGDVDSFGARCANIGEMCLWPQALRAFVRRGQETPSVIRDCFLQVYLMYGDILRQESGSELVLLNAYRLLLPPYDVSAAMARGTGGGGRMERLGQTT